ncbi:two component transcriptional regulator, LuxR family [Desulfocicer vacuolatum DSM 3385]|uniref:Two component transcriptional regulator, LuxR family n=1 Tax=Desulfocicer vacuolatum DSM 3385 TaxID=1121400 RepID=A0A1W2AXS3_9BACT|nr:response regulator transcription factor [Desulfocicer vacuolatum]SMC65509.1 two component transcriptional regulator, LuxR family [Desulfocicer vacuolatum DSM 3385]
MNSRLKEGVTIMIVDDHPIFCLGMAELINKEPDLEVCASEDTAAGAWGAIQKKQPDLVILDISLRESNGIDLLETIAREYPNLPVLMLSMYDESLYAERALIAGARGYIMKQRAIEQVVSAIRQVLSGDIYASPQIKNKVFNRLVSARKPDTKLSLDILTNRELEVFRLIGDGLESREIAQRLNLSIKTVGSHRENIKEKFHLKHYTELVKFAVHWSGKIKK